MNSKKVVLHIAKKEAKKERKNIDWVEVWAFIAIAGFLLFVLTAVFSKNFFSTLSISLYFFGLLMIISPVLIFQFNVYAGISDLKLELKDLKSIWFYAFNAIFIAANGVEYTFLNSFLKIVPMSEDNSISSAEYWSDSFYWILGLYFLTNLTALSYRWFKKVY